MALAWSEQRHPALVTTAAGLLGLGLVGWNAGGSDERRSPMRSDLAHGELAELFGALSKELSASGALYAYFDEEQALRAVVSLPDEGDFAPLLRLSDDPITRALLDGKPQAFTLYKDATALDQPALSGRSTLVYPFFLRGVPVGLAHFVSKRVELGEGDFERLDAWAPHLGRALESGILAERLAAARRENEALIAISRLAQSPSGSTGLFADAITRIRQLTGAQHAAIALRGPGNPGGGFESAGGFELEALATEGDPTVRKAFEWGAWDPREWPHLLSALALPSRTALLSMRDLPLTPSETSWLDSLAPVSHVLGVAFGDPSAPEGLLMLCWPDDEPLRFYETRLALALADQLALIAANRRMAEAEQVRSAAEHAALSRPSLASSERDDSPAPLGETLEPIIQKERATFRAAGLILRADLHTAARVPIGATALADVVGTMLDNARRFSRPGGRVRLWLAQDDEWATLYVADTGCGIPSAHHARIGDAGFQVDPTRGGSGASLALARRLVQAAGGTLGFTSREGGGSTFYVTLPIAGSGVPPAKA